MYPMKSSAAAAAILAHSAYAFRTKQELLSSGLAEKGDIILMWWSNSPGADGADNHIGFFWGEASDDDVMWHSGTEPSSGNQISEITPKTPGSFYILIKIEPLQQKDCRRRSVIVRSA